MTTQEFIAKYEGWFSYTRREELKKQMESDLYAVFQALRQPSVSGSIPSEAELVSETADAYCPNCEAYIVNERVTFDECCDKCGEEIEWRE